MRIVIKAVLVFTLIHSAEVEFHRQIVQPAGQPGNVSLALQGFLGVSPLQPTIAISFRCLEVYHQLRRRQASLSIQAMAKVLCSLHNVCFL